MSQRVHFPCRVRDRSVEFPLSVPVHARASGDAVAVSSRAELSSPPQWLISGSRRMRVTSWAGPWPVWEKWWDPTRSRFVHRLQVVDEQGMGWLMSLCDQAWSLEARYD